MVTLREIEIRGRRAFRVYFGSTHLLTSRASDSRAEAMEFLELTFDLLPLEYHYRLYRHEGQLAFGVADRFGFILAKSPQCRSERHLQLLMDLCDRFMRIADSSDIKLRVSEN